MSATELDAVVARMAQGDAELRALLSHVTEAQWQWKPAVDAWSLNEIGEHLTVVEQGVLLRLRTAPGDGIEKTVGKERLSAMLVNRNVKVPAPARSQPTGQRFGSPAECLAQLAVARAATLSWAQDPGTRLLEHVMPHPAFGELHGGQWLEMLAGHTLRHLAQMREVMASEGFPAD